MIPVHLFPPYAAHPSAGLPKDCRCGWLKSEPAPGANDDSGADIKYNHFNVERICTEGKHPSLKWINEKRDEEDGLR